MSGADAACGGVEGVAREGEEGVASKLDMLNSVRSENGSCERKNAARRLEMTEGVGDMVDPRENE